jgi:hypothetical protein
MTRSRIALALVAAVATVGAIAIVACSGASCQPGTLALRLGLVDGAQAADTLTVTGDDPGAVLSDDFPHAPNLDPASPENFDIAVTWPAGYPANAVVHLTVRAYAGGRLIAVNSGTFRLDPSCTSSSMLLGTDNAPTDGGATD